MLGESSKFVVEKLMDLVPKQNRLNHQVTLTTSTLERKLDADFLRGNVVLPLKIDEPVKSPISTNYQP